MLERVGVLIGLRSQQVSGGTFHSVANLLLRRYGQPVGLESGFTILDRGDSEDLLSLLRGQLGLNDLGKRFPRKHTIAEMFGKTANTLASLNIVILGIF
jgi:DNA helicase-2/ATP-dependent DNA helicase PcrA